MSESKAKIPRYMLIANTLRERIVNKHYIKDGLLPCERDLSNEFNASRNTIRGALSLISDERLIVKVRGKGNIINLPANFGGTYIVLTYRINSHSIDDFHKNIIFELIEQTSNSLDKVSVINLPSCDSDAIKRVADKCKMNQNIKGILLAGMYTIQIIKQLLECDFPASLIMIGDLCNSERSLTPMVSEIVGNDYQKMFNAVKYLKDRGCNKIVAFGSHRESAWGALQFSGYCSAMRELGLKIDPLFYISMENLKNDPVKIFEFAIPVIERLFKYDPDIDGIIMEHYGCRNIMAHLKNMNMKQCDRVKMVVLSASLCNYDDIPSFYYHQKDFIDAAFELLAEDDDLMNQPRLKIIQPRLHDIV